MAMSLWIIMKDGRSTADLFFCGVSFVCVSVSSPTQSPLITEKVHSF